jgi:hypothetical protein
MRRNGRDGDHETPSAQPYSFNGTDYWFLEFQNARCRSRVQLFTRLAEGRTVTVTELAGELAWNTDQSTYFRPPATSMGLLEKRGDRYGNTPLAEEFLVKGNLTTSVGTSTISTSVYTLWGARTLHWAAGLQ